MKTIDEHEFERICKEVHEEAPRLLQRSNNDSERTELLLKAVFEKVCQHLDMDSERQADTLKEDYAFALLQTLEERMKPEFLYSSILDRELLTAV